MADPELLVLDASARVELVIDGRHRAGADGLLARHAASSSLTLVSAAHVLIEAINALRRLTLRGLLAADDGLKTVEWLTALDLVLYSPGSARAGSGRCAIA